MIGNISQLILWSTDGKYLGGTNVCVFSGPISGTLLILSWTLIAEGVFNYCIDFTKQTDRQKVLFSVP